MLRAAGRNQSERICAAFARVRPARFAVEKMLPRKRSRFLELIGSVVVAVPADYTRYYEPTKPLLIGSILVTAMSPYAVAPPSKADACGTRVL